MPKRSRRGLVMLLGATLLVVVGCTPQQDWTTPLAPSWTADVQLLSEPVILDDVVLAYTVGPDGAEQIKAWRLDDGEQLWRQTVLPGMTPRHVDHSVAAIKDDGRWLVGALVPQNGQHQLFDDARFIVLDALTGAPAYPELPSMLIWGGRPFVCDDKHAFCVKEYQFGEDWSETSLSSFYPGDKALSIADFDRVPFVDGGTSVGTHLNVKDEKLRYGVDGSTVWTRDYTDIFGAEASIDAGWAWREIDATDKPQLLGVGYDASAYPELAHDVPVDAEMPLGTGSIVSLNPKTGTTAWQLKNAEPCPSENYDLSVYSTVAVLCRFSSGTVSWHWDGTKSSNSVFTDVEQEMLGVDISTGDVLWRHELDDVSANYAPPLFGGTTFLSEDRPIAIINGAAHIVDPQDGELTPIAKDAALLCAARPVQINLTSVWRNPNFVTAQVNQLCDIKGDPLSPDGVVTREALNAAGITDGEPIAINSIDGLVLYPAKD